MSLDEKKWLVSRLSNTSELLFDEFQLSKEDFIRIRNELESSIIAKRNGILSGVVFVLALLVALYETHWIDRIRFLEILTPNLLVGLSTSILAIIFNKANSEAFIRVENSITYAQKELNHNFGFLIQNTLELWTVPMTTIKEYGDFLRALSGIVYIPFMDALVISSKSRFLDGYYKTHFIETATGMKKGIEQAIGLFNNIDKNNLPKQSLEYVNDVITIYKKCN